MTGIGALLRRGAESVATVAVLLTLTFGAIHVAPGGPAQLLLGPDRLSAELEGEVNRQLGLDRPLGQRFALWLGGIVRGDLGRSYFFRRPAGEVVLERLPATLILGGTAFVLSLVLGIGLGTVAARHHGGRVDTLLSGAAVATVATPGFWLAILLVVVFAAWLRLLPSAGMAPAGESAGALVRLRHLVLPVLALALPHGAVLALYTRAAMVEALAADYTRTARAKGLGEGAVAWRHALRNAAVPITTVAGLGLIHVVEGSIAVESVFAWPGLGQLTVASAGRRDYPVLLAITLLIGVAVVLVNLATDLLQRALDPRPGAGTR